MTRAVTRLTEPLNGFRLFGEMVPFKCQTSLHLISINLSECNVYLMHIMTLNEQCSLMKKVDKLMTDDNVEKI